MRRAEDPTHGVDWAGYAWTPRKPFSELECADLAPPRGGLYRFRCAHRRCHEGPGLLYVGKASNLKRRLTAMENGILKPSNWLPVQRDELGNPIHRGHYSAPKYIRHERAGGRIEGSWVELPEGIDLVGAEDDLVDLHASVVGRRPPWNLIRPRRW